MLSQQTNFEPKRTYNFGFEMKPSFLLRHTIVLIIGLILKAMKLTVHSASLRV